MIIFKMTVIAMIKCSNIMKTTSVMVAGKRTLQTGQRPKHKTGNHLVIATLVVEMIFMMMAMIVVMMTLINHDDDDKNDNDDCTAMGGM